MLSLLIQRQLEERISILSQFSRPLLGDPNGNDSQLRAQCQHWVAYESSDYKPENGIEPGKNFSETRTLRFASYVEVEDLRRDYQRALKLHEIIMGLISGFPPAVTQEQIENEIRSFVGLPPVTLTAKFRENLIQRFFTRNSDKPISAKADGATVYRYRADYEVLAKQYPIQTLPLPGDLTPVPQNLQIGGVVIRSPATYVANDERSTIDLQELFFTKEE